LDNRRSLHSGRMGKTSTPKGRLQHVTAFTNLKGRLTVLNGMIYLQPVPLRGTNQRTPKSVLQHELGHILCKCSDEAKADKTAGL